LIRGLYDVVPNVEMFAQIRPTIPGKWDGGRVLGGVGEEWLLISGLFDVVPNVEMCELEKEMDKDESVVFRVGWATR
jgi:hypothetical protein